MTRIKLIIGIIATISLFATGCGNPPAQDAKETASETATKTGCASCAKGLAGETVWCDKCAKGFVDGKKTKCKGCVDAALNGTECLACKGKGKGKGKKDAHDDHKGHNHP